MNDLVFKVKKVPIIKDLKKEKKKENKQLTWLPQMFCSNIFHVKYECLSNNFFF